jgi:hypothetical protein
MTVSVERVEAWGDKDDYCGDGSCGISNPDDLRWVLKYEVSVPETMNKPFDPSRCPGELQILNGNDDESIIGVSGDYARFLDGNIFPGATKFGVDEYSIEKDALARCWRPEIGASQLSVPTLSFLAWYPAMTLS